MKHNETASDRRRIPGFDIARAFAVVGMVLVNFKVVMGAAGNGPAWFVWIMALFDKTLSENAAPFEREQIVALFGTSPMPPMPLYVLAGVGTACIVISLSVSLGQYIASNRWLKPLVSTGQLALTLYVAHVIIGMGTLEAIGRLENQSLAFSVGCALAFCLLAIVFGHWWASRFQRGPLEMIMRLLTD